MDFTRDESQAAVAEVASSVLEREDARDIALWPKLVDSGLIAVVLPGRYGGDDAGLLEVAALLTELGTAAAATPVLSTLAFGVLPLLSGVPEALADRIFPAVAEGAILTAALHEPGAPFAEKPQTTAVVAGNTVRITGRKIAVPYAEQARWLLVPTDSGLAALETGTPGVELVASPSSTGAPEYSIRLDRAEIPAAQLLADATADLHRLAVAGIGAVADGLLHGVLALTAEHLRTRRQFGRPLAEFQAVAQEIGDVYVASRTLHTTALAASFGLARDLASDSAVATATDTDLDVLAFVVAEQLSPAMQLCHHLHGGLGVDVTHPLHRYYSQAKDLTRWLGGPSFRLDRLGARCSSI